MKIPIKCKYCDKEFGSRKSMTNHRRHHYPGFTEKYSKSMKGKTAGEKHYNWKGDDVKYGSLHDYIRYYKKKSDICEHCKINKSIDLANISGEYKRDINDFVWLCRSCHMKMDYKSGVRCRI